jgi:hypothetical protein
MTVLISDLRPSHRGLAGLMAQFDRTISLEQAKIPLSDRPMLAVAAREGTAR